MKKDNIYAVKIVSGDKTSIIDIDVQIYDLLSLKNYTSGPIFTKISDGFKVEIQKDNKFYYWKTNDETAEILKKDYSIEII